METLRREIQHFFQRGTIPSWVSPSLLEYIGTLVGKMEDKEGSGTEDEPFVFNDYNFTRLRPFIIDCLDDCKDQSIVWITVRKCKVSIDQHRKKMVVMIPISHSDEQYAKSATLRPDVERTLQRLEGTAKDLELQFEINRQVIPTYK